MQLSQMPSSTVQHCQGYMVWHTLSFARSSRVREPAGGMRGASSAWHITSYDLVDSKATAGISVSKQCLPVQLDVATDSPAIWSPLEAGLAAFQTTAAPSPETVSLQNCFHAA